MPTWLSVVLSLLQTIISTESPTIRAYLLSELKALVAAEASHPLLDALLQMAETIVSGP